MTLQLSILISAMVMVSFLLGGAAALAIYERLSRNDIGAETEDEVSKRIALLKEDTLKKQWDASYRCGGEGIEAKNAGTR